MEQKISNLEKEHDPRWGNQGREGKADAIFNTLIEFQGKSITDGAWLDIGCGSGRIANHLAQRVESVVGVDPEPWQAWESFEREQDNLKFIPGPFDGKNPPVPSNSVDVVICNQVYEHVEDSRQLIFNIFDVLTPGGICYFAGPNLLWPVEPHVFWPFVHWIPRTWAVAIMRALGSTVYDKLDAYSRTSWVLKRWFSEAGFVAEQALLYRLGAESSHRKNWMRSLRVFLDALPRGMLEMLAVASPGHVFVLRKAPVVEGDGTQ